MKFIFYNVIPTNKLLFSLLLKLKQFLSLIHQSACTSLDHHVMNGQRTLSISTIREARNNPIIRLLFFPLFSSVLNKSPLWSLLFLEEIIVVSMRMSILSLLIHMINSTSSPTLTYSNLLLFTIDFLCFHIYSSKVTFSVTLRYFNLFLFTIFPFHSFVCTHNINFSPTLTPSNIFLLTTACFNS